MNRRGMVALAGVVAVALYAVWAAVQIFVLNPLAAAPGLTLDEVYAEMAAVGETMPVGFALGVLAVGVVIAIVIAVLGMRADLDPDVLMLLFLIVLVLGAPAYFVASFAPGMSLADTFFISGADASPWAASLYITSLLASAGIVWLVVRLARSRPAAVSVA
ncbi:hypothetical protein LC082_07105 [Microbacterium esteraromaticum]|uniref:hypothetical protein n=1 Tax=Microbacterium esteraromaticum TaxID=57043 RepID=UPI001CD4034A|nr:hypothetical protein [Microbacterium esteraromaticum]MCA1306660.1 hypothetical protein [Microbacterium esteraromaticum]